MSDAPVIRTGSTIVVDGHDLVVIDINTTESIDGRSLIIRCLDPGTAQKSRINQIKSDQISDGTIDAMKKLMEHVGLRFPQDPPEEG